MGFDTPTTHGICPECLRLQQQQAEKARQARKNKPAPKKPSADSE
jgi:hypothetical protein